MLIVITPENDIENEIELTNALFQAGLEILHLRKPNKNYAQHMAYLSGIDEAYHNKIVLHNEHDLAEDFMLKGIHIEEAPRRQLGEDFGLYVSRFTSQGYDVSTSFHSVEEMLLYKTVPVIYTLISPVFSAISKPGMEGVGHNVQNVPLTVLGMGGINKETILPAKELGYSGVGVLGGVWNDEEPLKAFSEIKIETDKAFAK